VESPRKDLIGILFSIVPLVGILLWILRDADQDPSGARQFAWGLTIMGILYLLGLSAWMAKQLTKADLALALFVYLVGILSLFTAAVYSMGAAGGFSEHMSVADSFYFEVTSFTTVSLGDITPADAHARVMVAVHQLAALTFVVIFAGMAVGRLTTDRPQSQPGVTGLEPSTPSADLAEHPRRFPSRIGGAAAVGAALIFLGVRGLFRRLSS
jgi:hypothetical protein